MLYTLNKPSSQYGVFLWKTLKTPSETLKQGLFQTSIIYLTHLVLLLLLLLLQSYGAIRLFAIVLNLSVTKLWYTGTSVRLLWLAVSLQGQHLSLHQMTGQVHALSFKNTKWDWTGQVILKTLGSCGLWMCPAPVQASKEGSACN